MLTESILKEAAADVVRFRLSAIPQTEQEHSFSLPFHRKMDRLIRRAEHPVQYQTLRIAAAIAVAMTILFGAVIAASPEVRAEVAEWFQRVFTVTYDTEEDISAEVQKPCDYRLSAIPEGYEEYSVLEMTNAKHYNYVREDGKILKFSYKYPVGSGGVSISGNYECRTGEVNGVPATLYISPDGSEASVILWQDEQTGAILWLKAWESEEKLIELAQMIEKVKE